MLANSGLHSIIPHTLTLDSITTSPTTQSSLEGQEFQNKNVNPAKHVSFMKSKKVTLESYKGKCPNVTVKIRKMYLCYN